MYRSLTITVILAGLGLGGCGATKSEATDGDGGSGGGVDAASAPDGALAPQGNGMGDDGPGSLLGDASAAPADGAGPGTILAVVRDFKFYDPNDSTTDPDFENAPVSDDHEIVLATLGSDRKPVYKHPGGTTVTTHGQAAFDKWYRDVSGTNYHVEVPLPMTHDANGSYSYDSQVSGVPYSDGMTPGKGFFPIDDGSMYATPFGNQGKLHNYSFTVEIHTVFPYRGGEYFKFRGDDDVFVFIDGKLVINLGGVHPPESAQVNLDSLGLTMGDVYPLDFFFAERHTIQSNVRFETTLNLQSIQ